MAQIGIKLADGSFFPILDDASPGRKRVVLAVAEEGQPTVQVDLLREVEDGAKQYVGCLVLGDLPESAGSELELVVGIDEEEVVNAEIRDSIGEQYQSISVSLDKLQQIESFDLPDEESMDIESVDSLEDISVDDVGLPDLDEGFDDDSIETVDDLDDDGFAAPGTVDEFSFEEEYEEESGGEAASTGEPRPFHPITVVALVIIVLSLVSLGAYAVFRWLQTEPLPDIRAAVLLPFASVRRFRRLR